MSNKNNQKNNHLEKNIYRSWASNLTAQLFSGEQT